MHVVSEQRQRLQQYVAKSNNRRSIPSIALIGGLQNIELANIGRCVLPSLAIRRSLEEHRLRNCKPIPSYSFEVSNDSLRHHFTGCQFLDVRGSGKTIIGCWGIEQRPQSQQQQRRQQQYPTCSQVIAYKVDVDLEKAE